MTYKNSGGGVVLRDDGLQLHPSDSGEWQEYQDWLAAGNTLEPLPPPPVPMKRLTTDRLAALLETKGVVSSAEIDAAKK